MMSNTRDMLNFSKSYGEGEREQETYQILKGPPYRRGLNRHQSRLIARFMHTGEE